MRKKGVFHCSKCESACTIYKKGKSHRVLVCPSCGVLASNPVPLLALASVAPSALKYGKKLAKKIPMVSRLVGGEDTSTTPPSDASRAVSYPPAGYYKNVYTTEERVRDALR